MPELPPAVEVQNLRKVYGNKAAVDGLSLTVAQGSFFRFLGPNGAGKTTTIKMLMGLAPPTSGTIRLLGMPMPERSLAIKQEIGLVPDESMLFDHLTGGEFVRCWDGCTAWSRGRLANGLWNCWSCSSGRQPEKTHRRIFQRHAQARGDGCGADSSAEIVPDGRAV
jgi:ABC-type branched-subunit amino acid transport system ATPase component